MFWSLACGGAPSCCQAEVLANSDYRTLNTRSFGFVLSRLLLTTLRILLKFCDIYPKNCRLRPLLPSQPLQSATVGSADWRKHSVLKEIVVCLTVQSALQLWVPKEGSVTPESQKNHDMGRKGWPFVAKMVWSSLGLTCRHTSLSGSIPSHVLGVYRSIQVKLRFVTKGSHQLKKNGILWIKFIKRWPPRPTFMNSYFLFFGLIFRCKKKTFPGFLKVFIGSVNTLKAPPEP